MNKREALSLGIKQLATDYNARPEDFIRPGITFTPPALNPGRRVYSDEMPFFELAAVGHAAVIMADEALRPELDEWIKDVEHPHWLLEFPRLLTLSKILEPYGWQLTQTFHCYLPAGSFGPVSPPEGLEFRLLERGGIGELYPNSDWPNALQDDYNPKRPDVLALAAVDGGKIVGMAGASADAPGMWQAGIDVLPEYRGRGLGTLLVRGLCHEVQKRGAVPFYGTSLSNIHSQNISCRCGFAPAWVAVSARKKGD